MSQVIKFSEIVEENGKTIRQNNLEKKHQYPLGTLVKVEATIYSNIGAAKVDMKGECILYVVHHTRDCDGTPLYCLSDIPVRYPDHVPMWHTQKLLYEVVSNIFLRNYGEDSMTKESDGCGLKANLSDYLS
jgi:hypothetical protein